MDKNDVGILITKSKTRGKMTSHVSKRNPLKYSLIKSICKSND